MKWVTAVFAACLVTGASGLAVASDGGALYADNCAKCHGENGAADTAVGKALKAAVLADAKYAELDAAALKTVLHENPKHKSVVGKVSDTDFEALAAHIRQLAGGKGGDGAADD